MTQEVHVFAGSLAQDLRLAKADATDADLLAALQTVGALGWVDLLPERLHTTVGAAGHPLTPLQAQQLALARLLLRDPDLAILDEATAEAGSVGARALEAVMPRVLQGRTALLVAHRLTTAAAADRVVVVEDGRITEQGPPQEWPGAAAPMAPCGEPGRPRAEPWAEDTAGPASETLRRGQRVTGSGRASKASTKTRSISAGVCAR